MNARAPSSLPGKPVHLALGAAGFGLCLAALALPMASVLAIAAGSAWIAWQNITLASQVRQPATAGP